VLDAKADLATHSARARYDPDKVSPEALAKAVSEAGFPAKIKP
jgi:copper chaperone CopZ